MIGYLVTLWELIMFWWKDLRFSVLYPCSCKFKKNCHRRWAWGSIRWWSWGWGSYSALVQGTALLFEGDKRDIYIRLNSLLGKVRWFYISGKVCCPWVRPLLMPRYCMLEVACLSAILNYLSPLKFYSASHHLQEHRENITTWIRWLQSLQSCSQISLYLIFYPISLSVRSSVIRSRISLPSPCPQLTVFFLLPSYLFNRLLLSTIFTHALPPSISLITLKFWKRHMQCLNLFIIL